MNQDQKPYSYSYLEETATQASYHLSTTMWKEITNVEFLKAGDDCVEAADKVARETMVVHEALSTLKSTSLPEQG